MTVNGCISARLNLERGSLYLLASFGGMTRPILYFMAWKMRKRFTSIKLSPMQSCQSMAVCLLVIVCLMQLVRDTACLWLFGWYSGMCSSDCAVAWSLEADEYQAGSAHRANAKPEFLETEFK